MFLSSSKNSENLNFSTVHSRKIQIFWNSCWMIRTQPISLLKLFLLYLNFRWNGPSWRQQNHLSLNPSHQRNWSKTKTYFDQAGFEPTHSCSQRAVQPASCFQICGSTSSFHRHLACKRAGHSSSYLTDRCLDMQIGGP